MIKQGLVAEVERLVNMGYDLNLPAMSSIGYKQIGVFLKGEITLATAIQQIKYETHRIARHQYSWFQLKDSRIKWFDIKDSVDPAIIKLVANFRRGA
jgi:tRNA dimethylallyltransferase